MSLLLEALKKAEKAKEEAQRKAGAEAAPAAPTPETSAPEPAAPAPRVELSLQDDPPPKHVVTRSELPDIHQPLEILSDDLAPAKKPEPRPAASTAGPARKPAAARPAEAPEASRAGARKVFEAKFKEPNPRLPFYITLGVLGVAAVGIVVYFWYQLRPPQSFVITNPPPAASAPAPAAPVAQAAPPAAPAPAPAVSGPIAKLPGLPATAPAAASPAPRGPRPSAIPNDPPAPRAARAPASAVSSVAPSEPAQTLAVSRPAPQLNPQVQSAYAAFMSGNLDAARAGYEAALRDEPGNRDALLGLAAIDVRAGRFEAAEAAYLRLLRADPRDAHAQAGLLGLRASRIDPLAAESRVKSMLAADPGAHVLHFTLGNQLAQQGRWPEAQQAYFKAYSAEPEHPDFAFNLAVSLDNLRQFRLAKQYYDRAIALAEKRGASFDLAAARERSRQLSD